MRKRPTIAESNALTTQKEYKPTAQEKTAVMHLHDRIAAVTAPRLKVLNDGKILTISADHPDQNIARKLITNALGIEYSEVSEGLLKQLIGMAKTKHGKIDEDKLNFLFGIVKANKPRDVTEAMLCVQMATTHDLTMTTGKRLARANSPIERDIDERVFNKLARTFTAQTETLKRYRSDAEQRVTVQTVAVSDGGQAIVGNVTKNTVANENTPANASTIPSDAEAIPRPLSVENRDPSKLAANRARYKPKSE